MMTPTTSGRTYVLIQSTILSRGGGGPAPAGRRARDGGGLVVVHHRPANARRGCGMHETATSPDGVPIVFEDHGTGSPALVLVHGWSCDRTYWRGQAELAERHR